MERKIKISAGNVKFEAELYDTLTAQSIFEALPVSARAQRWGDEIYFSINVVAELEDDSRDVLEAGELGFWPPGNAFCIFYGPTPASEADEIRAASAVNIVGKLTSDWSGLLKVSTGDAVMIEAG